MFLFYISKEINIVLHKEGENEAKMDKQVV